MIWDNGKIGELLRDLDQLEKLHSKGLLNTTQAKEQKDKIKTEVYKYLGIPLE